MFKKTSSEKNELFVSRYTHFIVLFLTLFSLLFVFTNFVFSEEIFIAIQKNFVVPQLEKRFGFRGKREIIQTENYDYEIFSIETVEPGSLFERAGFKPGDTPRFYGCRFFVIGKTDEGMFYSQVDSLAPENLSVFRVTTIEKYRDYIKKKGAVELPERKIYLMTDKRRCSNPQ